MEFKAVKVEEFKGYKITKLQYIVNEFANSGIAVAELFWRENEYKDYSSVQSSLVTAIKKMKKTNIQVKAVDKHVYLINKILFNEEVEKLNNGKEKKEKSGDSQTQET